MVDIFFVSTGMKVSGLYLNIRIMGKLKNNGKCLWMI